MELSYTGVVFIACRLGQVPICGVRGEVLSDRFHIYEYRVYQDQARFSERVLAYLPSSAAVRSRVRAFVGKSDALRVQSAKYFN